MKLASTLLTCTALTLAFTAPAFAAIPGSASPIVKTRQVDTTANGKGTAITTIIKSGKEKTIDTKTTFANGKTVNSYDTITVEPDGALNSDRITRLANGKTVSEDLTITKDGKNAETLVGTFVNTKGISDTVDGIETKTAYGSNTDETLTMKDGQTASLDIEHYHTGDTAGTVVTGTNFKNQAIDRASVSTSNAKPANVIDTKTSGQGSYNEVKTVNPNGSISTTIGRKFKDGNTWDTAQTVATNPNGSKTYTTVTTQDTFGKKTASTTVETYTGDGKGGYTIRGTVTSDGVVSQISGSDVKTQYGSDTQLVYTTDGKTRTTNVETLGTGDAQISIASGTNYNGTSFQNVTLKSVGGLLVSE
jgi:hypothetical protein